MAHYERYDLPKDPDALVQILDAHISRQRWDLNPRHTLYALYNAYGNGARKFRVLNLERGEIDWSFIDDAGKISYRHTKLPALVDRIVARATSLNWLPRVKKEGVLLQSVRQEAAAHTILRHLVRPSALSTPFEQFAWMVAAYGYAGLCVNAIPDPTLGVTAEFTPIHPMELYSFPAVGFDPTRQRGTLWCRHLPLSHLEMAYGKQKIARVRKKLDTWDTIFGANLEAERSNSGYTVSGEGSMRSTDRSLGFADRKQFANEQTVAEVRELWLEGAQGSCGRYIVQCGDVILVDQKFEDGQYFCPVHTANYMQSGAFKGLGLYDLLWSVNRQTETMYEQLFDNVRKMELYPVLMLPHGTFDGNVDFKATQFGMKYGYYSPDPFGGKSSPIPIQPASSGAFPMQVAQSGMMIANDIVPEASVLSGDAPGRVDGEGGLRFLEQQTFNPIASYLSSLQRCMSGVYKSLLSQANDMIGSGEAKLPITVIDSNMAGLVVDGAVRFDPARNPMPSPALVNITVMDEKPRTVDSRKMEAIQNIQYGLTTPQDALIFMFKEGLDPAVLAPEVVGAIRRTERNIAVLYGDGESPGQIILTPQTEVPWVAIKLVKGFMADPAFSAASVEVQNAFWDYLQYLVLQTQPVAPTGAPNPDGLVMEMMGQSALMAGAQDQGGPPSGA